MRLSIYITSVSGDLLEDNDQIKDGTSPHWRRDSVGSSLTVSKRFVSATSTSESRDSSAVVYLLPDGLVLLSGGVSRHALQEIALVALLVDLGTLGTDFGLERVLPHDLRHRTQNKRAPRVTVKGNCRGNYQG